MQVHVDRDGFFRGLQMVSNIVEPRQTLPILANVLLEASEETLRLTATDLEVGVRVSVPAKVTDAGSVTLSARKLVDIVKERYGAIADGASSGTCCGGAATCGSPAKARSRPRQES
jgi:DNA polymerase III sliding clamp (beta) subunit (PCNA family)